MTQQSPASSSGSESSPSLSDLLSAVDRQPPHYVHPTLAELCAALTAEALRLREEVSQLRSTVISMKEVINVQAAASTEESLQGSREEAREGGQATEEEVTPVPLTLAEPLLA